MGIEGITFAVREAFGSIRRNSLMSAVAITTVAVSLFLLAFMVVLSVNLYHMADMWESQVHLRIDLLQTMDAKAAKEMQTKIEGTDGVSKVTYVTKEEALDRLKKQFGERKDLLAGLDGGMNPLPNSFEVRVSPPQRTKEVAGVIEKLKGVEKVKFGEDFVDKLFKVTAGVRIFGLGLLVVMSAGAVLIISNTIRIAVFARRRDVAIMKLVGATDAIIRGPFLIEGMVLGLFGSMVSSLITWGAYSWLFHAATGSIPFLPLVSPEIIVIQVVAGLMLVGALIGTIGSGLSLRKYLQV